MIKNIINYLENKKIVILGFGVEGKSTYNFIRRNLPNIPLVVSYSNSNIEEETEYLNGLEKYDVIMKSPGISFKNIDISKFENKINSQLQLFLEYTKSFCIGITSTVFARKCSRNCRWNLPWRRRS